MTYSIVIPAYNEGQRITATLDKILAYLTQQHWMAEILVVNDGSRDNTADIIRDYAKTHPSIRLIENPGNRGKGYSVRNGMMHAQGDVLLFSDADLSSPIYEAQKLFQAIEQGADVAIGSRWLNAQLQTERQPIHRQLFGRIFNLLLRVILGLKEKDTQCGFKAFTRKSAQEIFSRQRIERWGFDPELLFLARKFEFQVREVPVEWAHDDRSKINPVVDGFKMFLEILKIRWADLTGKYNRGVNSYAATNTTGVQR
ncbi:MAG TPA: dolichyl-phosphate beta-glucosyltransferase [Terriglobales bacterium]|nr:dolichyl-phosphate beta-glucosyltransferase [Terriglobales bacterium]